MRYLIPFTLFITSISLINYSYQYGLETSQGSNGVTLLNLTRYNAKNLEVAADGNFTANLKLNEGTDTTRFTLRTLDLAMNRMQEHPHSTYHLIKAGVPYVKLASENIDVKYGEGVSVKLSSQHIEKMQKANVELRFPQNIFTLEDVKVSSELQQLLDNQGLEGKISTSISTIGNNVVLGIQLELSGQIEGSHEMPLLDLSYSVKENHTTYAKWIHNINITKATVQNEDGSHDVQRFGQGFNILPTVSQLEGGILPEALTNGVWLDYTKDILSAGITATLTSKDGTVYEGTINSAARYIFKGLPTTDEPYTLSIKLPGHFERVVEVSHLRDEFNGIDVGKMTYIFYAMTHAGDVNQDGVIDVLDAIEMKNHYGTSERAADLDHDGTVG
ncbi:dockerin type I domain-containing protein [Sutcliffiella horikoshii]|uniref:dockerin type I domain-containing protein n=1 Tax=Sutcliffiella horikoshii TaxID=79883 RepID=UPI003CE6BD0B